MANIILFSFFSLFFSLAPPIICGRCACVCVCVCVAERAPFFFIGPSLSLSLFIGRRADLTIVANYDDNTTVISESHSLLGL